MGLVLGGLEGDGVLVEEVCCLLDGGFGLGGGGKEGGRGLDKGGNEGEVVFLVSLLV